jgi:hypothetical protein
VEFFEPLPPKEPRKGRGRLRRDEYGRPKLMLPGYLGEDRVLALADDVAVFLHGIACYPRGFAFMLEVTSRYEPPEDEEPRHHPFGLWGHHARDERARFGIGYSDGRRVTLDDRWPPRAPKTSGPLTITQGGGHGGQGHYSSELWVQPLPPPGPVTFAVEWPAEGIEETLHTIEGERFREAAKRSKRIFPPKRRS